MTSSAQDQAHPPAAATVEPPKAAKRANVAPPKRRVAPTKLNMLKTVRPPVSGPKAKGPPKQAEPRR